MKIWIENIVRLVLLLLLQLLLINNLHFMGICNPCIYILFLIALPGELPNWSETLIAFVVGLLMDIACNSLGVHIAACVALSYCRPKLIKNFVPDDDRIIGTVCSRSIDMSAYFRLVLVLTFIHHTILFFFLNFTFHNLWLTIAQIIVSSLMTILLIMGREFLRR